MIKVKNRKIEVITIVDKIYDISITIYVIIIIVILFIIWKYPWCNGYRRRKWTRRHEFKSWTRLIAFHIALIPLGKV